MRKRASAARSRTFGMGCGSRAGKMAMHADGKPYVETDLCVGCGACAKICAHNGPQIENKKCPDRPEQLRRLRPLHRGLSQGRHPSDFPSQRQAPQLQDRRIRQGRAGRSSQLLHQHCPRRLAELRLPPGKRRPHRPGRGRACSRPPTPSRWIWPAPRLSTVSRFFQTAPSPI